MKNRRAGPPAATMLVFSSKASLWAKESPDWGQGLGLLLHRKRVEVVLRPASAADCVFENLSNKVPTLADLWRTGMFSLSLCYPARDLY